MTKTHLFFNFHLVLYISSAYTQVFISFLTVPNKFVQTYVDRRASATFVHARMVRPSSQIHFDNPDYFHPVFTNADLICRGNPDIKRTGILVTGLSCATRLVFPNTSSSRLLSR